MTDILFVTPNVDNAVKYELNGSLILGTLLLEAGFDVSMLRYYEVEGYQTDYPRFIEDIVEKVLAKEPRCVSFYTVYNAYHIVLRICNEIKKRNSSIITILGGPNSTALAQETLSEFPAVDYICVGEGENTVVSFFTRLLRENGSDFADIPGVYYRKDGQVVHSKLEIPLTDLETLPHWDERLIREPYTAIDERVDPSEYYMPVEVGRGCPYNCTFCSTCVLWKRNYRLKSPERIIKDIRYFKERFGYTSYLLAHDALTANQKLISELCDKLIESNLNINWECSTRVDCITEELIDKMIAAGMKSIHMGVETGSERMQKLVNKNLDLDRTKKMIKLLLGKNMDVILFFVYAVPGETEEDFNKTLELLFDFCDMGVQDIRLTVCMFTPDAEITHQYYDQLVFQPEWAPLLCRFGSWEEVEMIRRHKSVFASYYHLPGTLSEKYPFGRYLSLLYQKFPKTARYVRQLYKGDNLRFCEDFQRNNSELLALETSELEKQLNADPLTAMLNTIRDLEDPRAKQVRALLHFEWDMQCIAKTQGDVTWDRTYDFRYMEYLRKVPTNGLTDGTSQFLLVKTDKLMIRPIKLT